MKPTKKDKAVLEQAKKQGCKPEWADGILAAANEYLKERADVPK